MDILFDILYTILLFPVIFMIVLVVTSRAGRMVLIEPEFHYDLDDFHRGISPDNLPDVTAKLSAAGFERISDIGIVIIPREEMTVRTFIHREDCTSAALFGNRRSNMAHFALEFETILDDGTRVITTNKLGPQTDPLLPGHKFFQYPQCAIDKLIELHRLHVADNELGKSRVAPPIDREEKFRADLTEEMNWHIRQGVFTAEYDAGFYRLTWSAAFRMSWKQLLALVGLEKVLTGRRQAEAAGYPRDETFGLRKLK